MADSPSLSVLLSYRDDLKDAETLLPISEDTKLAALYNTRDAPHGRLLRNLTLTARPAKQCRLLLNGVLFGQSTSYKIHVTFNRLLMAPAIRLEFIWDSPQPLTMAFECQLFGTDLRLVQQIDCGLRGDWLIFNAAPSKWSTEGLDNVAAHFAHLGIEGQQLVSTIRQILGANTPQEFCLHLDSISADTRSCLPALLPYVFGVHRLPSLDLPAWSTYYPLTLEQAPHKLINADVPHPMTPFNCEDVLHSIRQLQVELWESSRVASVEQELSLRNLVDVLHKGFLFKIGRMVVMAVKWNDYQQLAGSIRCRVPDRLRTQITWTDSTTGTDFHCTALRSTVPVDVPVAHDALFVITKGVNALLRDACKDVDDVEVGPAAEVKLEPKFSRFSLESNLMTACSLESSNTSRWQQMLLNQNLVHDEVDLATTRAEGHTQVDPRQVEVEWDKICRWRVWNREQRRALQSIRRSAGGISLITGPAGTGKTLVQQALCAFLWRLGLHVLVLAPANSNCNDFIEKMNKSCPDVDGLRVFASSTELDLKDVVPLQRPTSPSTPDLGVLEDGAPLQQPTSPASPTEGSEDYASDSGTLFDFELLCAELGASNDPHASGRNFGVQAKVLKAAREGGIKLFRRLRETNGKQFGVPVDFWSKLREYMHACAEGSFDWSNESDVHFYKQVYEGCKAQIIARSRMIVTTTGNVMSMDIQDNWAQGLFNISCKGVVIILDEACKDKEIDTLAALMCPALRNKITGMVMVGDERQLEPTNVSAKGAVQFNPFNDRLGIPLLSRLKRQGFGCVELLEQHRMSHHIADFPFRVFYANGMRSSASTYVTLRNKLPGLHACLAKICESHLPSTFCSYHPALQDLCIRTKYVQVAGRRDNSTRSAVVREHIVAFFERIYWHLHAYFQEKTQQNVMIICAYKGAISAWQEASKHLQRKYKIPNAQLPKIVTIDSSQGTEATVTIVDCSVQQYSDKTKRHDMGFVDDDKRMNVAFTRAQEVRWVLGGDCGVDGVSVRSNGYGKGPAYQRYRAELEGTDALWVLGNEKLADDESSWLEMLEKKEVKLDIKHRDDLVRMNGH